MTPEQRVGRIANLMIFLGILYTLLSLAALLGSAAVRARGFGVTGLIVALAVIGLGYGIRYGSVACLYTATGIFVWVTGYALVRLVPAPGVFPALRLGLSGLALYGLCFSIPAMRMLKQTGSAPIQSSRYGDFFLRRWKK
ncbi:MAG: hypothetical protein OEU26_11545 [Candidatus Tectomicrobia bacterium]|nr:hypothetical protein [Candidatus Tectomicrobia bacterium]